MQAAERSIKTAQVKMRVIMVTLDSSGTPSVSGPDANQIRSVVDNGPGDITLIFKRPGAAGQEAILLGHATVGTTPLLVTQDAADFDRITVNIFDADTPAATDGVVNLLIGISDNRFYV